MSTNHKSSCFCSSQTTEKVLIYNFADKVQEVEELNSWINLMVIAATQPCLLTIDVALKLASHKLSVEVEGSYFNSLELELYESSIPPRGQLF